MEYYPNGWQGIFIYENGNTKCQSLTRTKISTQNEKIRSKWCNNAVDQIILKHPSI